MPSVDHRGDAAVIVKVFSFAFCVKSGKSTTETCQMMLMKFWVGEGAAIGLRGSIVLVKEELCVTNAFHRHKPEIIKTYFPSRETNEQTVVFATPPVTEMWGMRINWLNSECLEHGTVYSRSADTMMNFFLFGWSKRTSVPHGTKSGPLYFSILINDIYLWPFFWVVFP